jgi:hypothetical protein
MFRCAHCGEFYERTHKCADADPVSNKKRESQSHESQSQPWKAAGVSRATWFRRKAREVTPEPRIVRPSIARSVSQEPST